jgi:aldehyde dehydrogenase (NAD+)
MDFYATVKRHRTFFQSGATRPLEFRRAQLKKLLAAVQQRETVFCEALRGDLGKSFTGAYVSEIGLVQAEIRHALRHLRRWASPERRRTPWFVAPARGYVQPEPFGVSLIVSPWNYPLQLTLTPLVSAIAAGNCAVLKPSELAPRTAEAMAALVRETFSDDFVSVAMGGYEVSEGLLRERFDKIFYTGSTKVGRLVMAAAARHLTPVTLELGGKCPAIVCADAPMALAARRIAWGKFLNAGQTCVAPDFVLVQRGRREEFVAALKLAVLQFYGSEPQRSPDYERIVNDQHFHRLVSYLGDGKIVHGGRHDAGDKFIEPTILTDVSPESPVMQEEIFGPILPVIEFDELEDALVFLRPRATPLAAYVFTRDQTSQDRVIAGTRSGGVCVNDVVSQIIGMGLPLGGLGESGMGTYHGRAGFDAFTHYRSILRRSLLVDLPFRYPPQNFSLSTLRRVFRLLLGD